MIKGNVWLELIFIMICKYYEAANSIQNCVSPLVLRLQKVQEQ